MDANLLNGADLAFIGDAYYELCIRNYCLGKGITNQQKLHNECVKFVSRTAQEYIVLSLMEILSEREQEIFKRGRNYNYKTKTQVYANASGFEAVVGYLYLSGEESRLKEIIDKAIILIEEKINA